MTLTRISSYIFALSLLASCTSIPKMQAPDGNSMERAIPIQAENTHKGIAAENAWIAKHLPQCHKIGQALLQNQDRIYDEIKLNCTDGEKRSVFFEISGFFGKF